MGWPMNKTVIQVPLEGDLLEALNSLAKESGRSRADVIRRACRRYLKQLEDGRLDRIYQEGYIRVPEEPTLGHVQASLASEVLPEEAW